MLYALADYLTRFWSFFNVVHYISFRSVAALLTALLISLMGGASFIAYFKNYLACKVRDYTPQSHKSKNDTPTMGGLFIVAVVIFTTLLWAQLEKKEIWIFLLCLLLFGGLGFWDDLNKIHCKKGISESMKFKAQIICAFLVISLWVWWCNPSTSLCIPFFKNFNPDLGFFFVIWGVFLLVATSNAVNLTDGLDGLAIGSLISNFAAFSVIAYIAGHYTFAQYLHIPFAGSAEMAVPGAALIGGSLGFLWYNTYPAQIFMGDVGSLALGAVLALMALMSKQELLLGISGGLFVVETLSVILQVFSFKRWGKRIFKMTPLHHHFELLGWPESQITVRFGIISLILCLLALITLKLR
ncbi:MAG: phospho-N-acetylmuramoyl-pentapeptide-transferase [Candidatus Babeliaceae bacterium]